VTTKRLATGYEKREAVRYDNIGAEKYTFLLAVFWTI
jgi:hypothetical protein